MTFQFEILHQCKNSAARVGRIHTPHGIIDTPGFVAVGTNGTLKSLDTRDVETIGLQLMFCNTYHLLLQPGPKVIEQAGGLHSFMNRSMPIITDSGGFQVFSLSHDGSMADELKGRSGKKQEGHVLKISEDGVLFRSYRNGDQVMLTPELSITAQKSFGADIILPLDELLPHQTDPAKLRRSLERTHRWEERSLRQHLKDPRQQAIYAIIHGGIDLAMREESCKVLSRLPFNGYAIGGSLGRNKDEMAQMLSATLCHLPPEYPRHLLGIGDLESLERCIPLGIDTFDSSYPTRAARHGLLLTQQGPLKITRTEYADAFRPIEAGCGCSTCKHFTLGYLNHLFKANELTAFTLATIHNLHFMVTLMARYRAALLRT
jgi:queuine tRNA-ribosyltransferase